MREANVAAFIEKSKVNVPVFLETTEADSWRRAWGKGLPAL